MTDLSILIPARNEMFLSHTIQDILQNIRADTEIIAVLDGSWPWPPVDEHKRLTLVYYAEPIGQRAAVNAAARMSEAKYVMKVDAHCSFDEGFDAILLEDMQEDWTCVPIMKNLHAFDWVCENCGTRKYQGPQPEGCAECGESSLNLDVVWTPKPSPNSSAYRFTGPNNPKDEEFVFKYWGELKKRPVSQVEHAETMSLQGSCWMISRDRFHELNICDENFGSWGQQGVEVACKTWLSGGKVICNKRTWYAHMFRTQPGFKFPYHLPNTQVQHARAYSRRLFIENNWDGAIRPFNWILEHFAPVPEWDTPEPQTEGVLYYTDNKLDENMLEMCQNKLEEAAGDRRIVSVSLKPIDFGENIHMELERGYLTLFKQILAGLEKLDTDIVHFAEHDVLYHPSHFDIVPPRDDTYYYNTNVWKLRLEDGFCLYHVANQTSGLSARRSLLLSHYRERVEVTQQMWDTLGDGVEFRRFVRRQGYEPGTHNRKERVDMYGHRSWESKYPNVDIRHGGNLTPSRWRKDQFRNQKYTAGWQEGDEIPGWGKGIDIIGGLYNGSTN